MNSGSASEGEIVDSGSEKANTALPPAQHNSVNRRLREALSPSPASPRSPSPTGSRRSRNHSPSRASRTPRGEKRRRPDDDYRDSTREDGRKFKVHYENRAGAPNDRRRTPYKDLDRNNSHSTDIRYDDHDNRDRHGNNHAQTGRSGKVNERYNRRPTEYFVKSGAVTHTDSRDKHGNSKQRGSDQQSVTADGHITHPNDRYMSRDAETRAKATQQQPISVNESIAAATSAGESAVTNNDDSAQGASQSKEILTAEERRRRREAIKAKYNNPAPTLLVQALHQSATPGSPGSPIDTSQTGSPRSASPSVDPRDTLEQNSAANSPPFLDIVDNEELANPNSAVSGDVGPDESSAADYDPTMDMLEDRARSGKKIQKEDASATGYDEMDIDQEKKILLPKSQATSDEITSSRKHKTGDDMFVSDDEDDMFAPETSKDTMATTGQFNVPVNIPKARELDVSLLDNWDDSEGYYKIILTELLDGKYQVQAVLGKGMFATVVRAIDIKSNEVVAIKIIRNNETMSRAGQKEMDILQKLAEADPDDKKHIVRLYRSFTHKGHLCMVFENLNINLREVLKKFGRDIGINLKAVRIYAQQMFLGLSLLRKCNILHADLKPDNILVNENRSMLKICDLGSAADASENGITPYLVSRFYRAPEIILGLPYDFAIDMWSIGCTLFELYTGKILFTGRSNNQMLKSIMECRGRFSIKMLKKSQFGGDHFDDRTLEFRSFERDTITGREIVKMIHFTKPTRDLKSRLLVAAGAGPGGKKLSEAEVKEINLFADLLDRCFNLHPERRITPLEALKHPFVHRAGPILPAGKV